METVGERIKKIRKDRKLTQKAFAEQLKMSENYIWQIEKGDREPSDKVLRLICSIYNVDEIWLQTGTGDMDAPKTRREELEEIFHHCEIGTDAKARLIRAMAQLPDSAAEAFLAYVEALVKALSEE